ncbi:acyl carrier protein, partial [Streptomyces albospinus]|uniref:acyl carrier protein n=1 Tax=Streptomyces albospinus TaxID=285515 RepID=UPI001670762D
LPAHALAWGLWDQDSGMTGSLGESDLARWARTGVAPLAAERGLELLDAALVTSRAQLVPACLDLPALKAHLLSGPGGELPTLFRGLVRMPVRRASAQRAVGTGERTGWLGRLAALSEADRLSTITDTVRGVVASVLGHSNATDIDLERGFKDLGFDSLTGVELRNRLNTLTGLRVPATLVFDYPTPTLVAAYLGTVVAESTRVTDPEPSRGAVAGGIEAPVDDEPIAIVGMACRYPGGVASA